MFIICLSENLSTEISLPLKIPLRQYGTSRLQYYTRPAGPLEADRLISLMDTSYRVCTDRLSQENHKHNSSFEKVLTVSICEYPPYTYESPPGSRCFKGLTISLLSYIAKALELRLVPLPARDPVVYNTSPDGPPFDVLSGRADVSACPLGIAPARLADFHLLSIYTVRTYQMAVHKSFIIEGGNESLLRVVFNSFNWHSWTGITAVSLWVFVLLWWANALDFLIRLSNEAIDWSCRLVVKKALRKTYWEFLSSFVGQADFRKSIHVAAYNCLIVIWFFWILIISSTSITVSLTAELSMSPESLPFNTPDSFLQSDFQLVSRPLDSFQTTTTEIFRTKTVVYNVNNSDAFLYDLAEYSSTKNKSAVVCIFVDTPECADRGLVGAFDLGIKRGVSLMQLRKNTDTLSGMINKRILRLMQGGLTERLMEIHRLMSYRDKEFAIKPTGNHHDHRKGVAYVLRTTRLQRIFYSSAGLLVLSVAVFIYEARFSKVG